jgi:hypothetical protein
MDRACSRKVEKRNLHRFLFGKLEGNRTRRRWVYILRGTLEG